MRETFCISKRTASKSKQLREKSGFGSMPDKKREKRIPSSTIEKVQNFYLSDYSSRILPGINDYKTVIRDGKKIKAQKRLLLYNLVDLHKHFKLEYPDIPIGLSKFQYFRPCGCILTDQNGTHKVCVCKIHQNVALKI